MSDESATSSPTDQPSTPPAAPPPPPPAAPPAPTAPDTGNADKPDTGNADLAAQLKAAEAEVAKWKELSRKHEERSRASKKTQEELERLRREAMTEQERLVEDAKTQGYSTGRQEILSAIGAKLVRAEMRAASGGRLDDKRLDVVLERVDVMSFMADDGTVKDEEIRAFVDAVAPAPPPPPDPGPQTGGKIPDMGQGARGTALNGNPDPLLATLKGKLGIG